MRAGYGQADITPELDAPVYLAGFGRNRVAMSVHDPLSARALALSDRSDTVIVVALDLIGLSRGRCLDIAGRVRERAPQAQVIVACTHTHHGPDTLGLWGPDERHAGVDPGYLEMVRERAAVAALAALDDLQPANLRLAACDVPGVARNGRDPGILDIELTCAQLVAPGRGPLAMWLTFPCHPEVLWADNPHITADYVGFMRQAVEDATGAPCIATAGALGGMMTPDMPGHAFADAEAMGVTLARAGLDALAAAPVIHDAAVSFERAEFAVPLTNPVFRAALGTGLLAGLLDANGRLTTEASLLRVGPLWCCNVPGELLPALGLKYKAQMRAAQADFVAVIGLANDELGYILPAGDFVFPDDPSEPGVHYEETMSVGPEAGPRLSATVARLIARATD